MENIHTATANGWEYSDKWHYMTFHVGMVGVDGIVIAGDQLGRYASYWTRPAVVPIRL